MTNWQDILDLLNLGDMPPKAADLRPEDSEISKVVNTLTDSIAEAHALSQDQSPQPVLRRLNRREYLNTVRDLFGFNMTLFDPSTGFPEDDEKHGFDNLGATLVTSSYLLENILGAPPAPPPPDVEPLEPDIRGATSIREQLQKHRKVATCAECHAKIDPLGFALEGFNAVGGQRRFYDDNGKVKVDTSGNFPDGTEFDGIEGLRFILSGRKDQFAHCLTEKLLTYATGREMTVRDRSHIDAITTILKNKGYGLQDLVLEIISSEPFRITGRSTTLARN
ncbi:MAG: DUF1585 domain-containing protein [Verrucomicrobia bacterium]|nr:DUF1585 domain-containing protein [Verrucomicrobiota bacterium]